MTTTKSYKALSTRLADNNIGAIDGSDIRDLNDTYNGSNAIEAFDTDPTGDGVTVNLGSFVKSALGSLTDLTEPPAWMWPRTAALASALSGASHFSQIDGDFALTADSVGYTYTADVDSVPMVCRLETGIYGSAVGASMLGALVIYRTINSTFPTATHRHHVIPFDTGPAAGPFFCRDDTTFVMAPGDSVRVRLEYYGTSAVGASPALTPAITSINIANFVTSLITVHTMQPTADAVLTESSPDEATRLGALSEIWAKASGVPLANRSVLV